MPEIYTYFAYGSNMSRRQMRARCPDSVLIGPAEFPKHRLAFSGYSRTWGGGVATVVADRDAVVQGLIYRVTAADLLRLDRFEGHPNVYRRSTRFVRCLDGERRRAEVYLLRNESPMAPGEKYVARVRRAYRTHGFDTLALRSALESAPRPAGIVFVYGTLLYGERNHAMIAGATYIGQARTQPLYSLYDLGSYPALVAGGATAVAGELYAVSGELLAALDKFEGVPHLYRRAPVALESGTAEAYLLRGDQVQGRRLIASGSWAPK